jgi:hypothetical protein
LLLVGAREGCGDRRRENLGVFSIRPSMWHVTDLNGTT